MFYGKLTIDTIYKNNEILKNSKGQLISNIIFSASFVYLKKQYSVIALIIAFFSIPIGLIYKMPGVLGLWFGFFVSVIISFITMFISTISNIKVVNRAQNSVKDGFNAALGAGFLSASCVSIFALFIMFIAIYFENIFNKFSISIGVSVTAILARLGGGVFTKGADVAADLVGKLEYNMTEDDLRNPAVIADAVGDNVGDCVATVMDLMESVVVAFIAMINMIPLSKYKFLFLYFLGIQTTLLSFIIIRYFTKQQNNIFFLMKIFNNLSIFFNILTISVLPQSFLETKYKVSFIIGIILSALIIQIVNYYTSSKSKVVHNLFEISKNGAGLNLIHGLSVGFVAILPAVIITIIGIMIIYMDSGLSGIFCGVMGILSTTTTILTQDLLGPIVDNAGGIVEIADMDKNIRDNTDQLDELGNVTKAITKGYTIVSSIMTSVALLSILSEATQNDILKLYKLLHYHQTFLASDVIIKICVIFIGGIMPYYFSGLSIRSVSEAANFVVQEVKTQIKNKPDILTYKEKPDYNKTISLLTIFSLKKITYIFSLPIIFNIVYQIVIFIFGILGFINNSALGNKNLPYHSKGIMKFTHALPFGDIPYSLIYYNMSFHYLSYLNDLILGSLLTSTCIAIHMIISGGLFDNCKKYTKAVGYKNTEVYRNTVIGDTVGDPFKDTTGPALNCLNKYFILLCLLTLDIHKYIIS